LLWERWCSAGRDGSTRLKAPPSDVVDLSDRCSR